MREDGSRIRQRLWSEFLELKESNRSFTMVAEALNNFPNCHKIGVHHPDDDAIFCHRHLRQVYEKIFIGPTLQDIFTDIMFDDKHFTYEAEIPRLVLSLFSITQAPITSIEVHPADCDDYLVPCADASLEMPVPQSPALKSRLKRLKSFSMSLTEEPAYPHLFKILGHLDNLTTLSLDLISTRTPQLLDDIAKQFSFGNLQSLNLRGAGIYGDDPLIYELPTINLLLSKHASTLQNLDLRYVWVDETFKKCSEFMRSNMHLAKIFLMQVNNPPFTVASEIDRVDITENVNAQLEEMIQQFF